MINTLSSQIQIGIVCAHEASTTSDHARREQQKALARDVALTAERQLQLDGFNGDDRSVILNALEHLKILIRGIDSSS